MFQPKRLACLIAALTATGLHAQETVLKKVSVYGTEEAQLGLTVPARTSSRLNMTPLQTPASVDVISSETIRSRGQNSVAEAVSQNGVGVTTFSSPIFGSAYASRGFAGNNSVMQLFDGTRLYLGIGNITFPFDTWNVERVEVLHGPASVLYGEGAIGGVVNVVPKRPATDKLRHEIQLSAGSDDTYGAAIDSTGPLNDVIAYRFSASGRDSNGWTDLGENSSESYAAALRVQATSDLVLTLSSDYGRQQPMAYFGTPLIDGQLRKSLRNENYNVRNHRIEHKDSWNQIKAEWTPSDAIAIRNTVYQVHSRREWRNLEVYDWNAASGEIDRSEAIHIVQSQNQIGDRFDVTINNRILGGENALVVGFDVNTSDFAYSNNFYSGGGAFSNVYPVVPKHFDHGRFSALGALKQYESSVDQHSVFFEDRFVFSEQWSVIAGARYDHIEIEREDRRTPSNNLKEGFDSVSWRAGVVYNPVSTLSVYAQYATATDPVAPLLTLTPSNEQFDLSEGEQWEIGIKQSFLQGRGEWTASYFDITKEKLLVRNLTNMLVTDQIGQQSSHGIELALSLALGAGWHLDTNATWLKAEYDKFTQIDFNTFSVVSYAGNVPLVVPERSANLWLGWDFLPAWTARAGVQYVGSAHQDYANETERKSYTVTHANLEWRALDNTVLMLQVHNLFDRVYAENWHGENQWFLGNPRTLELSARMKF